MKIAIITDQHFDARNSSLTFSNYFKKFYDEIFFPHLKHEKIDTILDLGDTFDRRKYVNFNILQETKTYYFDKIKAENIQLISLVGNHTSYFKNTLYPNTLRTLLSEYPITIVEEPIDMMFGNLKIALIPWICDDNRERILTHIKNSTAPICAGHFELSGFQMHKGSIPHKDGFNQNLLNNFQAIFSGHFHHRSNNGRIFYLGAPYEMTWADYDDPKGYHIFDTDTKQLDFFENPFKIFKKFEYDDTGMDVSEILNTDFSEFSNSYLKILVKNNSNPYTFDLFINAVEQYNPLDIQIFHDLVSFNTDEPETEEEITENIEDTLGMMKTYINQSGTKNAKQLTAYMTNLYHKALLMEE